jgi:hypothetical protein
MRIEWRLVPALRCECKVTKDYFDLNEEELRRAVLAYLAEHPRAMDTLEGISAWWVRRHQIRVGVERVSRVLLELTRRGVLEEVESGEHRYYRLKSPDKG